MSKRRRRHGGPPRLPLAQVSPAQLLMAFDQAVQRLFCCEDAATPLQQRVAIGRDTYPLGEILTEIQAFGKCHGMQVDAETRLNLYELLGKANWSFHSDYFPGTYKQAAAALSLELAASEDETEPGDYGQW